MAVIRSGTSFYSNYSRYFLTNIYGDTDSKYGNYEYSDFVSIIYPDSITDQYYEVESGYANRLDLISYKVYRTVHLWWIIAMANDILNPLDIPVGTILRIIAISDINRSQILGTVFAEKEF
jgi:hypothetical protein